MRMLFLVATLLLSHAAFAQESSRNRTFTVLITGGALFAADKSLLPKTAHGSVFNTVGDGKYLVAGLGALYLSGQKEPARRAGTSLINAGIATVALKALFGRERPEESNGTTVFRPLRAADASFPSGHASISFAVAHSLARDRPKDRAWLYGAATLVGIARVRARRHFASDVFAGALLGVGSAEATRRGGGSLLFVRL
jgi:membrane-associated phospholipid phosphatase